MNYQKYNNDNDVNNELIDKSTNSVINCNNDTDTETSNCDISELLKILSEKINNIEIIDEFLINEINYRLNLIKKNHNNKILTWHDDKFYSDLDEFKQNNNIFCKLVKFNEKNSYILINNNI